MADGQRTRRLTVELGDRSYPVLIGPGLLKEAGRHFRDAGIPLGGSVLVVTDGMVDRLYGPLVEDALREAGYRTVRTAIPPGETSKSLEMFERVITTALEAGLDRGSTIAALGGGVVGDLAGFAAAAYMRGIRFVQMPTTILAHDSSVGGKVGINHRLAKNIIGAFHQPSLVLYDLDALSTLPPRQVRAGLAEIVKEGLIWDRELVRWCDENADRLLALEPNALGHALHAGCRVKAAVVARDERENDLRAILNYGHTIGHALEAVADYQDLLHGEAIAIGMVGAARLAARFGRDPSLAEEVERLMRKFGLPVRIPAGYDTEAIMAAMMRDKKFRDGRMTFILPVEPGRVEIRRDVPPEWVREVLDGLKEA